MKAKGIHHAFSRESIGAPPNQATKAGISESDSRIISDYPLPQVVGDNVIDGRKKEKREKKLGSDIGAAPPSCTSAIGDHFASDRFFANTSPSMQG